MATEKLDIFDELQRYSSDLDALKRPKTFGQYVNEVTMNPRTVKTSHRLLYDAVTSRDDFFESGANGLYGLEKTTKHLVDVLRAGAEGLETRKRIILLMGPVGGGKSTLVNALKSGLEQFTRTDQGEVYTIVGCPMHEEPLNLIPEELRPRFRERYGVKIEGKPCPQCHHKYRGKLAELDQVPLERVIFSEADRVGIGTFKPSDPKSQDITELVGSVDFSKLPEYGTASDPRAYRFDGELNVANRGLMEFVEMLKSDERFLYALLDLTQDRVIKAPRFPNIYADEVIIAHTNETEYKKFVQNKANEALQDRTIVIAVPYNLRVSAETKIYDKLINQSEMMQREDKPHISPLTLRVASMFAVLSRLKESKKADLVSKMKLYDGQDLRKLTQNDLRDLQEEFPGEGMDGISPRYVIDCLSAALTQEGLKCLTPIDALRALKDGLDKHPHTRDLEHLAKEGIKNMANTTRQEYDDTAKKEVQSAFVDSFSDSARMLCDNYLDNVEAFLNKTKVKDPITEEDVDPDERLMRSIEEKLGDVPETSKREFRQEVWNKVSSLSRRGEKFDYRSHPRLKEAVEKKLFADLQDIIKITTSAKNPNKEQSARINEVSRTLVEERGYCAQCANSLIKYVGQLLNR